MTGKRIVQCAVVMVVLVTASLVAPSVFARLAALAQTDETPTDNQDLQAVQAVSEATEVDPFTLSFTAYRDTWVDQANPHTNYGEDLELTLSTESGAAAFALLRFNLSTLPADAQVISATLSAYSADTSTDAYHILPYAVTSAWVETAVTWDTRPGTDQLGDPIGRHVPEGWTVFEVTNIVQAWRDGSLSNNGIALRPDSGATGSRSYQDRKTATPAELTVYYTRRAELTAIADTWVGAAQPSTAHGSYPTLNVWSSSHSEGEAHALVNFDFASLSGGIAVSSATLSLYSVANLTAASPEGALVADLYADAILESWDEATATWNEGNPGYDSLGDPPISWVNGWNNWDVTNIVQSWANGSIDPFGILLRVAGSSYGYGFWSRDLANPPTLVIDYGAAPPDCNPITSIDVNGATAGITGESYTFDAVYFPADADPPDNIRWSETEQGTSYGSSVTWSWDTTGDKTISVTASHCGGVASTSHTITISEPSATCETPIAGLSLDGPVVVGTGASHSYTALASPPDVTWPVTFTWEATGMAPDVMVVDANTTENIYTWPVAGSKTISVTAENCGGTMVAYQSVEVIDAADLPDLLISTAWIQPAEDRIAYVIHNEGDSAAPGGFSVALKVGPDIVASAEHAQPVAAGGVAVGYLDYAWTCAGTSALVSVMADAAGDVDETDESNNEWTETWTCDQQPPHIVTGPTVVDISETKARAQFTTDEACQGWVEYGTSPYNSPHTAKASNSYLTSHSIPLGGMVAGTTYFVRAFCEDEAGLRVNSEAVAFETAPPGSDPPTIRSLAVQQYPYAYYEIWEVIVELEDSSYMDRVSCTFDGTSLGIDYSADTGDTYPHYDLYLSPYQMGLTRNQFFGQTHSLICTAYRQDPSAYTEAAQPVSIAGNAALPAQLWVDEPPPNHKIYVSGQVVPPGTLLDVTVKAAAHEWACTSNGFSEGLPPGISPVDCDELAPVAVDTVKLWVDGSLKDTATPAPSEFVHTLTADIGVLAPGEHEILVSASRGGGTTEESRTLIVEHGEASVEVTRSIRREGNTLVVTLDLHNPSPVEALVPLIVDHVFGLQPILGYQDSGDALYEVKVMGVQTYADTAERDLEVLINIVSDQADGHDWLTLPPGETASVSYTLVPELHDTEYPPRIGKFWVPSTGLYQYLDVYLVTTQGYQPQSFDLSATLVDDPASGLVPLEDAVANAIRQADYVLVTVPGRIYALLAPSWPSTPDPAAEQLFSNMAELASLENGVLGMLFNSYTQPLDDLLEPGNGSWNDRLSPSFNDVDEGYVLIVGETEILSSFYVGEDQFVTGPNIPDHVHDSDLWYANTRGETARPELVVGRVIGNDLDTLNTYFDNVIAAVRGEPDHGFNRSRALLISGTEDRHENNVNHVADQMDDTIADVNPVHWTIWDENWSSAMQATKPKMTDNGIIFYNGHGNDHQWCYGVSWWDLTGTTPFYDLGSTNPAVLAASCKTGHYESSDDMSVAEAFLGAGAGVYVGATESVESESTSDAFRRVYSRWDTDESMGQALNQTKRAIWELDWGYDHRKLWAFTNNLYGDPKYGRLQTSAAATTADVPQDDAVEIVQGTDATEIKISLPKLTFYETATGDRVEIPGGELIAEIGSYPVPVWLTTMTYRPGTVVQDVTLESRGQPIAYAGLSLPVIQEEIDGDANRTAAIAPAAATDWYPSMDRILDWSVEEGPNGKNTLTILLYPFYYNAATGDALYYHSYELVVDTLVSAARIESVLAPSTGKNPGDAVELDILVSRTGKSAEDVILQASVRTGGTNKILGGIPLKTLHKLLGTAQAGLTWNTKGYAAGDYQIVVELLDTSGRRLDTAVAEVRLGTVGALLDSLSASQEAFAPGDQIGLSMSVENTGTVPISGEAVFLVQRVEDLSVTELLTATVTGLAPGASIEVPATWDTTGADAYRYRVLGYFKFFSQATEPRAIYLYRPRIFLPLVTRH